MKDMPWDHGLRVTAEADGLIGHAGAVLLRKLDTRCAHTAVEQRGAAGADSR